MSDERDHIGPPDDDIFAAEYVLGVLSVSERAQAERRISREHGFAALVDAWQARLANQQQLARLSPRSTHVIATHKGTISSGARKRDSLVVDRSFHTCRSAEALAEAAEKLTY